MITKNDQRRQTRIKRWLENDVTILQFMQKHACLIADFYLTKMELDLYQMYMNMTESTLLLLSQMSQTMIKSYSIDPKYLQTDTYIKQQIKILETQNNKVQKNLIDYLQHQEQHQVSTLSKMDMILLRAFIFTFVQQDQQQYLHADMQKKKISYLFMPMMFA
ncbi:unnamed protein product [Rotaria sp. Silwood2]|nr:unnamed protein product [Rotaria sp. Silwood2]CAF2784825.1 unnamed protein product [Rotaria sp. Silwood2]CAF3253293.1 unnamed protein product [Rotaria sp. Silwood2]CAF3350019.1 unnamed protein product [Rotaria sp. Silwood2]